MQFVPATAILQPGWVRLLGIHLRDAVVNGDESGYGKDDGDCQEDGGECDERSGAVRDGAMLVGCAEDEREGQTIPKRHGFAEDASQRLRDLGVGVVVELSELRVDEHSDCELVAHHGCCDGCGCDVIERRHDEVFDAAGRSQAS